MIHDQATEAPSREPFTAMEAQDVFSEPENPEADPAMPDMPAVPQEAAEAPQTRPSASDTPSKLGITAVRELDQRVDVMIARINSFRVLLAKYGVDGSTNSPSMIKRELVAALIALDAAERRLDEAKLHTHSAYETLASL